MSHPAITIAVDVSDTGGVFAAATPCGRRVCLQIVRGDAGAHAADWRRYYLLTDCCGAATTGGDGGIVCKHCGHPVAGAFDLDVPEALSALGCPCPEACAIDAFDALDDEARRYGL